MKVLNEKPPEWIMQGCMSQFRVNVERTFWTYGDTIYNPGNIDIPDHIMAHEEQHGRQQEAYIGYHPDDRPMGGEPSLEGKDAWWREYLSNPRFRLEQEAEAYGEQHKFFCDRKKDRNQRERFVRVLAGQLSGPLYQLSVTGEQARAIILVLSGQKKLPQVAK